MSKPDYHQATFVLSAVELEQLPTDEGAEVAFIGHSNAGKSSSLNAITGIKGLARISKTPGRTQAINVFSLDDQRRLIDLPGYGYAKVPLAVKQRWQKNIDKYLQHRHCLRGLVLVMDIRHPLKKLDQQLLSWSIHCHLPIHILLTKVDKLKRAEALNTLKSVNETVKNNFNGQITVQLFSSLDHTGLLEATAHLNSWFNLETL